MGHAEFSASHGDTPRSAQRALHLQERKCLSTMRRFFGSVRLIDIFLCFCCCIILITLYLLRALLQTDKATYRIIIMIIILSFFFFFLKKRKLTPLLKSFFWAFFFEGKPFNSFLSFPPSPY